MILYLIRNVLTQLSRVTLMTWNHVLLWALRLHPSVSVVIFLRSLSRRSGCTCSTAISLPLLLFPCGSLAHCIYSKSRSFRKYKLIMALQLSVRRGLSAASLSLRSSSLGAGTATTGALATTVSPSGNFMKRWRSSDAGDVIGIDLGTTNSCVAIMVRRFVKLRCFLVI